MREDSRPVTSRDGTIIIRPRNSSGSIAFNGKRWRGDLVVTASGAKILVINRVNMDDYLAGVVPLEIGTSAARDEAAIEAQAIAARSYAVTHLAPGRPFDMRASVLDQVYGGIVAETPAARMAVEATTGLVLLYGGQPVNAPYSASCGGTTAEPEDVWRTSPEPYLARVSDQIPGTDRFYCDIASRHRWTVRLSGTQVQQSVARYLASIGAPNAGFSRVNSLEVQDVTPGGRVATLRVGTDRGTTLLRGNDIRSALRLPGGDMLYSTYFSVEQSSGNRGLDFAVLNGGGNGHGVGMCQSGAIGRARAGQDFRTILRTYYPGTTVGTI